MILRLTLALAMVWLWSCSGDEEKTQEPVATDDAAAKMPDSPGDAAETAAKPAGEGQAAEAPPAEEKSSPNVDAAAAATPAPAPAAGGDKMVKAAALNVRSGPGTKHSVVRILKQGEKVQTQSCEKNWCKIGESEFVSAKYLTAAN